MPIPFDQATVPKVKQNQHRSERGSLARERPCNALFCKRFLCFDLIKGDRHARHGSVSKPGATVTRVLIGNGRAVRPASCSTISRNQRFAKCAAEAYHITVATGEPWLDHIETSVWKPGRSAARTTYQRLVMPVRTKESLLLLGTPSNTLVDALPIGNISIRVQVVE